MNINYDYRYYLCSYSFDGSDLSLRPSTTTENKIIIETFDDVVFIPIESVCTGPDSIPFVYKKNKTKQIVALAKSNKKNVIVEQALESGTSIYLTPTEESQKFKLVGENLISIIKEPK